ncbi:MAG: sulfite exporter TauE/SafE family protein [Acidaminococcales bacterium]|nr:sulfite exporter TauE/SafE family protein [Acidaminococcales bacterium]
MEKQPRTEKFHIDGMSCVNCENKIAKKLGATAGVKKVSASYGGGYAVVTYDAAALDKTAIAGIIGQLGYKVSEEPQKGAGNLLDCLIIIAALYMIMRNLGLSDIFNSFPLAEAGMDYWMLFAIGLLTSVHCVAMCGGINMAQCLKPAGGESKMAALRPGLLYNMGRVISYTAAGGAIGALGAAVSLSDNMKGMVQIAAGFFMVVMGVNILGIFPALKRINLSMPRFFTRRFPEGKHSGAPFYVGLLNGLMPCGPLQAMQLYALSAGGPLKGALSMLIFSLGTVPLMFGLSALSSALSANFTKKAMSAGAMLVVAMGMSMFNSGLSLTGFAPGVSDAAGVRPSGARATREGDIQVVATSLSSGQYEPIVVQAGVPVRWTINAPKGTINGCNNSMVISAYGVRHRFRTGENVIEFTPDKAGRFSYSCWMGMIRSSITVVN